MKRSAHLMSVLIAGIFLYSCQPKSENIGSTVHSYLDLGEAGIKAGGVKMIPVAGGKGKFGRQGRCGLRGSRHS